MRYTVQNDPDQPSFKDLVTILDRTGKRSWDILDITVASPTLSACLGWGAADIDGVTTGLGVVRGRLQASYPQGADTSRAEPPAQVGWIRATASALEPFPELSERADTSAAALSELVDKDSILRAVGLYAGRIKDGAIDARLLAGAYGWFVVSTVLDGLRAEVKTLSPKDAEVLLAPFSPLLVLVGQIIDEQDALKKKSRGEAETLAAAVQEAQADRDEAEAALKLRGAPKDIPHETLLGLAQNGTPIEMPTAPRRTRRR